MTGKNAVTCGGRAGTQQASGTEEKGGFGRTLGKKNRPGGRFRSGAVLWGMAAAFTALYVSLIFNDNVWTDEIFSMNLFAEDFGGIIRETAADVHPPLYYFLGRVFRLLFGESLQVQKLLTILPMSLTLILGATKVKSLFGARTAFWFLLFLGGIPCTMQYAVQVRMYSWALLCVTVCGLAAWEIVRTNSRSAWVMLAVSAVAAAYLHYFAFASVLLVCGFLFLVLLFGANQRKKLVRWLVCMLAMAAVYLPWLPFMAGQVTRVEAGYWIQEITWETVRGYFTWTFGLKPLPQTTWVYLAISLAAGLGCLIAATGCLRGRRKQVSGEDQEERAVSCFALLCMLVPSLTAGAGILLSLVKQPIYRDQYVFPAMGLFCLFLAIGVNRLGEMTAHWAGMGKIRAALSALLLLFVLFTGAVSYRDNFRAEYLATLTEQTEEFFQENMGENDLVVYNYQAYYFNYKYYFPEEKLSYVREVDLDQDFDTIWFLDTEMEWDFVPEQILNYELQIEYVGHYGIEDNEFDVYCIRSGKKK